MKRLLLFTLLLTGLGFSSRAAVGDTTWVQAHNTLQLTHYGYFDTTVAFPDGSKSYRRIYMIFTLGKYHCPGNPQYCGDWDYTVQNYLMTKNGDTVELGRLITPYANASNPRTPWTMQEPYVFDVTDYYPLLKDSATVRINYSGYSWGFTADVKFMFIEGTPARNVLGIQRLWHGYFAFGNASDPIENHVPQLSETAPANTNDAVMKLNITGHGSDNNGCGEFCKKYYLVKLNGSQIAQKDIWRDNCGLNPLSPQTGTWIYNRANWCPGALVESIYHDLPGISGSYNIDMDFEPYTDNGNAGYNVEAVVFYYGNMNKSLDAELSEVIAPSNNEKYFRQNPTNSKPIVRVTNQGSTDITSVKIQYYVGSNAPNEYTWQGTIKPFQDSIITLPEDWSLRSITGTNNVFTAQITEVNGKTDDDASNNTIHSYFTAAPQWPMTIIVSMTTNRGNVNGVSENSWKIVDALGNIMAQRNNCATQTTYRDTVNLGPGSYTLMMDDQGCDGLNWWGNSSTAGVGNFSVRGTTSIIPFPLSGYANGDFGCGFNQAFNVIWPTEVVNVNARNAAMEVYPNPAANLVNISFTGMSQVNGTVKILDAVGRVVVNMPCSSYNTQINTANLTNGVYNVIFVGNDGGDKMHTRLVINK